MSIKTFFGIDPGKSGGWAYGSKESGLIDSGMMPIIGGEICVTELAGYILEMGPIDEMMVVIEKVNAMPKQGVTSTFTFGMGYGKLLGMCQTIGVRFDMVRPQTWKKIVLKDTKKDKNAAIDYVKRIHPKARLIPEGCKVPKDGIADAICLMDWGIKNYG